MFHLCVCVGIRMMCRVEIAYLCVCGWDVPSPVYPQQGVSRQGDIELDVLWVVDGDVEAPEQPWRDGLHHRGPDVHLAPVYGLASLEHTLI